MGQYHGKFTFDAFSRLRPIIKRTFSPIDNKNNIQLRYPPYSKLKFQLLKFGLSHYEKFYVDYVFSSRVCYFLIFSLGFVAMFALFQMGVMKTW